MYTIDSSWKQFRANALASYRVTTARTTNDVQRQLAGHLALCEAADAHLVVINPKWESPLFYSLAFKLVRECIQDGISSDRLNQLAPAIDQVFYWIRTAVDRNNTGPIRLDAVSALGWLMHSVLCITAGMVERANECGRHTLDAVARIVIQTGHLRSDLIHLMRELGVSV